VPKIQRKSTRGKFRQAVTRAPVFGLGQWDTAQWTADTTLAEMLLAVIHAPDEAVRAARLEALASQRLFVSMPRASPRVRTVLAALCRTPEGQLVYREAYPCFCLCAVRLAWRDVQSERDAADAVLAARFRAKAMQYMVQMVLSLEGAASPTDALAHLGALSAETAAGIDELIDASIDPSASGPMRDGALELVSTIADTLQYTPPRDRDRALTEVLVQELFKDFGGKWRAQQAAMRAAQATMLGLKPGALRMRESRRKKRDAAHKDASRVKSKT
jgi:hypothetical protein